MTKARTNADNVSGDIAGITAGTGLTGGGTGGTVTLDLTTPVASTNGGTGLSSFTTGDIIYSSSGNTLAKLGIGTTSQVLTVAGGVPSWATASSGGGITLLSTTTLSGTETTISSISGSYTNLYIIVEGVYSSGTLFQMYLNSDASSNYNTWGLVNASGDDRYNQATSQNRIGYLGKNSSGASNAFSAVINIYNYASSDNKSWTAFSSGKNVSDQRTGTVVSGSYYGSAVSSIKFDLDGSSFGGGTAKVYGVK